MVYGDMKQSKYGIRWYEAELILVYSDMKQSK